MYDPPYCAVCGAPFDYLKLLDFAKLGDDEEYLKEYTYDSQILSPEKSAWIRGFRILALSSDPGERSGTSVSPEAGIYLSAPGQWKHYEDWYEDAHTWINPSTEKLSNYTATRYQGFFVVHSHCMDILQKFLNYQASSPSPHSPKQIKELLIAWRTRQKDDSRLRAVYANTGEFRMLPPDAAEIPNVEHSHLYFGARRFWDDPWDSASGYEYLCADPTQESEPEAFLATCLTRPHQNCNSLFSSSAEHVKSSEDLLLSESDLVHLPREIHDLVISHLSLKDALSFCSTSQKLSEICDGTFWRLQTKRLHGCWLWELQNSVSFSLNDNWKMLLQILATSRSKIQGGAKPYWENTFAGKDAETIHQSSDDAELSKVSLPIGLRNRQRIWMCLESWVRKSTGDGSTA
ncbi:MAG: hypothetical protein Q9195_005666 [Heterodermia aff. obscurata]